MTINAARRGRNANPKLEKGDKGATWSPARALADDPEARRIFARYRRELFDVQGGLQDVFGAEHATDAAAYRAAADRAALAASMQSEGLELLARAHIEDVPRCFNGSVLVLTVREWKHELLVHEAGPEPLTADVEALDGVVASAKRLRLRLDRLAEAMDATASRILDSRFTIRWPRERLGALRLELDALADAAGSADVVEDMRRPHILSRKPAGGWSAREAFFGYDLPRLYKATLGRPFAMTVQKSGTSAPPSEGMRFACVVAFEVLGRIVEPENVKRMAMNYGKAAKTKRRQKR